MRKPTGFMISSDDNFKHSTVDIATDVLIVNVAADAYMDEQYPTTVPDNQTLKIGDYSVPPKYITKTWIKPNFTGIPAGSKFDNASFLRLIDASGGTSVDTIYAYRCLRAVVESQMTWNVWSTGNNWGTAGCGNSTSDYDGATELGTGSVTDGVLDIPINGVELTKMFDGTYTNNGIILFGGGVKSFYSSEHMSGTNFPAFHFIYG